MIARLLKMWQEDYQAWGEPTETWPSARDFKGRGLATPVPADRSVQTPRVFGGSEEPIGDI